MASYQIPTMEQFNFTQPDEWPQWIRRFERFRQASGISSKAEDKQVNTLIYTMGAKADDILQSFRLSADDEKKYETVKNKFKAYFIKRRNPIFERAKFNSRKQDDGEPVDDFITDLYTLAKHCEYRELHDQMIRDRIVCGIKDAKLSERMQMDANLTLEKAITMSRQSESVKSQQATVRGDIPQDTMVDSIAGFSRNTSKPGSIKKKFASPVRFDKSRCTKCGRPGSHNYSQCPAKDSVCHNCGKVGHFKHMCRSRTKGLHFVESGRRLPTTEGSDDDDNFLGVIYASGDVSQVDSPDPKWHKTLHVNKRGITFKVDTGADVTVIPSTSYNAQYDGPLQSPTRQLTGAGQHALQVDRQFWGCLQYNDKEIYQDIFVVKGLTKPLLGRPAIDALQLVSMIEPISTQPHPAIQGFPKLFQGLGKLQGRPYSISLRSDAQPYALCTPRRVAIPLLPKVEAELARMQELGVTEKVEQATEWCAGMVVVPKANGQVRICMDLTKLNKSVCRERHILPSVEQTLAQIGGAKVFTKLDANSGFWQVELSEDSSYLTAFITPFGRFCFRRLPFGITSAPEFIQKRMNDILCGLEGVVCMVDDILVYGKTQADHDRNLTEVLKRIQASGLTLNQDKCEFSRPSVRFLGQLIDPNGICVDPEKVNAISNMSQPQNTTELRRFLGMVNQLNKFSPHLSDKLKPLQDLLSSRNQWTWGPSQEQAFHATKEALVSSQVLAQYDPLLPTIVLADASSYGLGAVLTQKQSNTPAYRPVAYISRTLTPTEQHYTQIAKEALAVTWACERFQSYLLGIKFHIHTDHKPLVPILSTKPLELLPIRVQRFRLRMMRFDFTISHVPGNELYVADTLSRSPISCFTVGDDQFHAEVGAFVNLVVQGMPATDT